MSETIVSGDRSRAAALPWALAGLTAVVALALGAPVLEALTGHPRDATFPATGLLADGRPVGPGREFWLGADPLGRDVLVRAAHGARISLVTGLGAALLATALGVAVGVPAGLLGGAAGALLGRSMDAALALPALPVAIVLATVLRPASVPAGVLLTVAIIALSSFAVIGRVLRARTLSLRECAHVQAARALGAGPVWIATREVLPALTGEITALAALTVPAAIAFESTLAFLGAGVRPPVPTWGMMLGQAADAAGWWLIAVPGGLLLAATASCALLAGHVRHRLDPRTGR